jgi:hypothetical protein
MNTRVLWTSFAAVAAVATSVMAAAPLNSGLKPGDSVSPFHPKHIAGPLAGTTNCFPCTFQNRPQVQAWVKGDSEKNVLAIAKTLSTEMASRKDKEFKALVVVIADSDKDTGAEKLAKTVAASKEAAGIGVAILPKTDEAVENYGINTDDEVKNTVLVYKDWKVQKNFVNLTAADTVKLTEAIASATK